MNTKLVIIGGLALVTGIYLPSCKKQDVINIQNQGNFTDTAGTLRTASSLPIGVAVDYAPTLNNAAYLSAVKQNFSNVTFGYQMKHGAIVQGNGALNFTQADAMVAQLNGVQIYGHTLGWHQNQNEGYLESYTGLVQPAPTNIIVNGGFESGSGTSISNWSAFNGSGDFSIITGTNVHSGTQALQVVNPTSNPGAQYKAQLASDLFNTAVNANYQVTLYIKAVTAGGSMRLSTQNSTGGNASYQGDQTIGTGYTLISWTFAAKDAQTRVCLDIGLIADTYYVDDFVVNQVIPGVTGAQVVAKLDTALNTFVTGMVNHYKGTVHAWDVCNEVLADDGTLRNNTNTPKTTGATDWFVWTNYLGKSFLDSAFIWAHNTDPTADLFLNDYSLESNKVKLDSFTALAKNLKSRGIPITGVGTQMHININTSYAAIDAAFVELATTGLKVRISEMDVRVNPTDKAGFNALPVDPVLLAAQADMYHYVINSYLKNIPTTQQFGITIWGVDDPDSWIITSQKKVDNPLLFDAKYAKKPAYSGVLQALKGK